MRIGEFSRGERLVKQILGLREKQLGPGHPEVGAVLNTLAQIHDGQGRYLEAETVQQRSLSIAERELGPNDPRTAMALTNLAVYYVSRHDYARAEPLHTRALAIMEKARGPDHVDTAGTLHTLGWLYLNEGAHERAEPLLTRALAIKERALPLDHPGLAATLGALGQVYLMRGEARRSEPLFQRALAIDQKVLGADKPGVCAAMENLARSYFGQGDYLRAEPLYKRALEIRDKALGPDHPLTAVTLRRQALLHWAAGAAARSKPLMARAASIDEKNLALILTAGSEDQKGAYLAEQRGPFFAMLSFLAFAAPGDSEVVRSALQTILQIKGRLLEAVSQGMAAFRQRANADDRKLLDELLRLRTSRATLTYQEGGLSLPIEYLGDLRRQEDRLEAAISSRLPAFQASAEPVTLDKVQAAIPSGAVLVELVSFRRYDPRKYVRYLERRYAAFVLTREGPPAWADLGETEPIDELVRRWRYALNRPGSRQAGEVGRELYGRLLRPVQQYLRGRKRLLMSPDGALNLVPFGALVDGDGRYLVENFEIGYLGSGRDLIRLKVTATSRQPPVIVVNPDYDGEGAAAKPAADQPPVEARRSADFASRFDRLEGGAEEAATIRKRLTDAKVLTWDAASEAAVKQLAGPRILHIATHGFFEADQTAEGTESPLWPGRVTIGENALLRSGLALAGANRLRSGAEDGILTALEVSGLDLWGTQLAVLSACNTGVGDVVDAEGVYGLRRALVLAGARTQVMSLWKVSDTATRDLMAYYYKRLLQGAGRAESLRAAQLRLLADQNRKHPYYWASFISSGETGPLGK